MLKLATLLDNPGEPPIDSRYADPAQLKELGFTGMVVYPTTALSGVASPDAVPSGELRRWVQSTFDQIQRRIETALATGLDVYLFYDMLVLPQSAVHRQAETLTCRGRPDMLCPASEQAVNLSVRALEALLGRWPSIAGIVLRFGDTDAPRLPHLIGNDIYAPHCPRCSQFGRADRINAMIDHVYRVVVQQSNKRLIVRAWNVRPNGLHDSPELATRVVERLPGDPADDRLILSFKFTETDFWRYQPWNRASLLCSPRPIMYELQCQREFEGKGAIPNWQVPLWQQGHPEMAGRQDVMGLMQVAKHVNLAGLWAWVRGGGWGGPFVKDETWIDANVFAVPRLADEPATDATALANDWIRQRLSVEDDQARQIIADILAGSAQAVRQGFYMGPYALTKGNGWHPNADWIQDDMLDAAAAWRMIQRLPESSLAELVREKEAAASQIAAGRAKLQQLVSDRQHHSLTRLISSMIYAETLFDTLRDLVAGLVAYRRYQRNPNGPDASIVRQKLLAAQSQWNHHTQRLGSLPDIATSFRETHFWELTQQILTDIEADDTGD